MNNRYVCIHGHFYQPPRENPWLEEVELQDCAYPYHDWNERITFECYAPNTSSRILDRDNKIIEIVSNYKKMSFNFGPTLLSWMQRHSFDVYRAIVEADRKSRKIFSGHGSAIAQAYNHMIMPLANSRDKRTQVLWGINDFVFRFKRQPEGMWLPETAVDLETLDIMAEYGIKFTILSPYQAKSIRKIGANEWLDASGGRIDPKLSYFCNLPSGRKIAVFFYDGPISRDIAFSRLLDSGENFVQRMLGAFSGLKEKPELVHVATDGETYGHHHHYGEMALSYCLNRFGADSAVNLTVYGEFLEKFPPEYEVIINENSSWSCFHGIERWRADCGCKIGPAFENSQAWRVPLRSAMDWLRDNLSKIYEQQMSKYAKDPWQVRDEYIELALKRNEEDIDSFFSRNTKKELSKGERIRYLRLLEMQRYSMLMYTSCGWFFDDISGIETVQILQYAARAMQLGMETTGVDFEPVYLKILEAAPSNNREYKNGACVYIKLVKPAIINLHHVSAHYAVSSLFKKYPKKARIYCYQVENEVLEQVVAGKQSIIIGRVNIRSEITEEENIISFTVFHFGDHNLVAGVSDHIPEEKFNLYKERIKDAFKKSDISEIMKLMDEGLDSHNYSLWNLFKDEQRIILDKLLDATLKDIEGSFRKINEEYYSLMQVLREKRFPLPKVLSPIIEFILNTDIRKVLESEEIDLEKLQELVTEVKRWSFEPDRTTLGFVAGRKINLLIGRLFRNPRDTDLLKTSLRIFKILGPLSLDLGLWKAQNIYFSITKLLYNEIKETAEKNDDSAKEWIECFNALGDYLGVKTK